MGLNRWISRAAGGTAGFTVTWNAPETDADGSAVSTITSYRVRWSRNINDGENASRTALVTAPTVTYSPTDLVAGTWYVWVSTITAAGESDVSPPLKVTAV